MSEGIDIYSRYQTVTDWSAVKRADITWCYQKVSDGMSTREPQANRNYAGVSQGGYHFSQPGSPVEQAKILLSQCEKYGLLDLNPCLDMEDNPSGSGKDNIRPEQKADYIIAFGRWVLSRGHGFTLYANNSDWGFFGSKVMQALPQTFRWVARYGANPTVGWDAHQYTSSGSCPGITSNGLDRNRGKVPLNKRVDDDMSLDPNDQQSREAIQKWIWFWDIGGGRTAGSVLFDSNNQIRGLTSSVQKLTNLVVADDANDVTLEQVTQALEGFVTTKLAPVVREVLSGADFTVDVDKEGLAEEMLNRMYGRLQQ